MSQLIASLNYGIYADLISNSLGRSISVSVYDVTGEQVWDNQSTDVSNDYLNMTQLMANAEIKSRDDAIQWLKINNNLSGFLSAVVDNAGEPVGNIAIIFSCDADEDEDLLFNKFVPSIKAVVSSIVTEYALTQELEAMAAELSERYDELNLIYTTEDDVQKQSETNEVLQNLVQNCVDYLDVSLTALVVPECHIDFHHCNPKYSMDDTPYVLEKIKTDFIPYFQKSLCPDVFNSPQDYQKQGLNCILPGKLVSVPFIAKDGSCRGILASFKSNTQPDYTNSDRNLLLAMIKKVAKILNSRFDALTGLLNRQAFEFSLEATLLAAKQQNTRSTLLFIDVDQTQIINDTASYHGGDAALRKIASIFKSKIAEQDTLARIGGDVFGVLLYDFDDDKAIRFAEDVRQTVSDQDFHWKNIPLELTVSIGVCEINPKSVSIASIFSGAEVACDAAKEQGRNKVCVYSEKNTEIIERKGALHWVGRIQEAFRKDMFEIYAQPIEVINGRSYGFHFEILLRIQDENGKIFSPGAFLQAAERYQMMPSLDKYVIKSTLAILSSYWSQIVHHNGTIAINLAGQSIASSGFLEYLIDAVESSVIPAQNICFEVTETTALGNLEEARNFIFDVKDIGCHFALDDFGTGLSSFSYLKALPLDYLKIDGSFITGILNDAVSEEMVKAIQQVCHLMGLKTIAEFVESDEIKEHLKKLGINYAQGYSIGKPIPLVEQLDHLIERETKTAQKRI